jgi:hypothetical protein
MISTGRIWWLLGCGWLACAPACAAYYRGSDGIGRIVTTAGSLQTWQVALTPAPHLVAQSATTVPASEQDPGFFTVVSSNERASGSAIVWAVGRPTSTPPTLTLYAFSATPANGTLQLLYSAPAGQWPHLGGNANVVPLVANGRVYVGAYKTLTIFGLNGTAPPAAPPVTVSDTLPGGSEPMPRRPSPTSSRRPWSWGRLTPSSVPSVIQRQRRGRQLRSCAPSRGRRLADRSVREPPQRSSAG